MNCKVLLTVCGCLIGHYGPGDGTGLPSTDGIAVAGSHAESRDVARGTLFLLLIYTGIYSGCEPIVHYFTKLSYILCTLLGWNSALNSPHMVEEKDAHRSHPLSEDICLGCLPLSPVLRPSHGPSVPPTCSWRQLLPKCFYSSRRNLWGEEAQATAPTHLQWQTAICHLELTDSIEYQ